MHCPLCTYIDGYRPGWRVVRPLRVRMPMCLWEPARPVESCDGIRVRSHASLRPPSHASRVLFLTLPTVPLIRSYVYPCLRTVIYVCRGLSFRLASQSRMWFTMGVRRASQPRKGGLVDATVPAFLIPNGLPVYKHAYLHTATAYAVGRVNRAPQSGTICTHMMTWTFRVSGVASSRHDIDCHSPLL